MTSHATYLLPYLAAARRHGAGFGALLWTSPQTQAARFDAMARLYDFDGRRILDAGCGRADLLDYFEARDIAVEHYTGLEAVADLAAAARAKQQPRSTIIHGDFVADPHRLDVGVQAIVFCGSLNTLEAGQFYATLRSAFAAAADALLFNFLDSPYLAGADYLGWYAPRQVMAFLDSLPGIHRVNMLNDYMRGDCTMMATKET